MTHIKTSLERFEEHRAANKSTILDWDDLIEGFHYNEIAELREALDSYKEQKPVAWLFPDIGMTTTSEVEKNKWLAMGRTVLPLYIH
jgi:hypothetical protein